MENDQPVKSLLYGELTEGKHLVGHPKLRCKDTCKSDLMHFIDGIQMSKTKQNGDNWLVKPVTNWMIKEGQCIKEAEGQEEKEKYQIGYNHIIPVLHNLCIYNLLLVLTRLIPVSR